MTKEEREEKKIDLTTPKSSDPLPDEDGGEASSTESQTEQSAGDTAGGGSEPEPKPEQPPSLDSLSILGVTDSASEEEGEAPPWHDPMMPIDERMALSDGLDQFSQIYASLGQTDCTSCGYADCRSYAKGLYEEGEEDLSLCIPGDLATEEKLHDLLDEVDAENAPGSGEDVGDGSGDAKAGTGDSAC